MADLQADPNHPEISEVNEADPKCSEADPAFPEFSEVVKALEDHKQDDAIRLTQNYCEIEGFVHATDKRKDDVSKCFQYRYRRLKRNGFSLLHYAMLYNQPKVMEILLDHGADPRKKDNTMTESPPLDYACLFGDQDLLERFLSSEKCKEDLNKIVNNINKVYWCPLYYVAERKNPCMIKLLLDKGADPTIVTSPKVQRTAIQFTCLFSSPECVETVLQFMVKAPKEQVSVNGVDHQDADQQTALHLACSNDSQEIAKLLVEVGKADIDKCDKDGKTALHLAICSDSVKCAEYLVEKSELALKEAEGEYDTKLLKEAINFDRPKIVLQILESYERNLGYSCMSLDGDMLHRIVQSEAYSDEEFTMVVTKLGKHCIEYSDNDGRTPIMLAAMLNKYKKLEILLDKYINILMNGFFFPFKTEYKELYIHLMAKKDKKGDSAVHLAVKCDGPNIDFEATVKVLGNLKKRKELQEYDLPDPLLEQDRSGMTGMHLAIKMNRSERALILLAETGGKGVEFNDKTSSNVIHFALQCKIPAVQFEKLLDKSLDASEIQELLRQKNSDGKTALQMALKLHLYSHAEHLITTRLRQGSDEIDGNHEDACNFIVNPNEKDSGGKNALHIAIEEGCPTDLFIKLLDRDCSPVMADDGGKKPVHVDEKTNVNHVIALLDNPRSLTALKEGKEGNEMKVKKEQLVAAIRAKRPDIIKLLLTNYEVEVDSHILELVMEVENEDYANLLVRYAHNVESLMEELRNPCGDNTVLFHEIIKKMPAVAEEALQRSAIKNEKETDFKKTEILLLNEKNRSDPSTNTLAYMVECEEIGLLEHPGVKHVLDSKWRKLGLPLYYSQFVAYCFLIIPLSILVLLPTISTCDPETARNFCYDDFSYIILVIIILSVTTLHVLISLIIICMHKKHRRLKKVLFPIAENLDFYLQCAVFFFVILVSILTIATIASKGCCRAWTWHVGLFAITLGWTYLIRLSSKLPIIGKQVIVFQKIILTFLKLSLFALLLVLAATIVLMITFFDAQALQSPFNTFGRGVVTVLTMITGELDYSGVFGLSYDAFNGSATEGGNLQYPETANFVWVVFLILIPILLSNMLTGLAVGDVIELQRNAALRKLAHKVNLVNSAEYYLNSRITVCLERQDYGCVYTVYNFIKVRLIGEKSSKKDILAKERLLSYEKKRQSDLDEIKRQFTEGSHDDTRTMESIDDVKQVALSCETMIKEFKDAYERTITKLKEDNVKLRRDLQEVMVHQQPVNIKTD